MKNTLKLLNKYYLRTVLEIKYNQLDTEMMNTAMTYSEYCEKKSKLDTEHCKLYGKNVNTLSNH